MCDRIQELEKQLADLNEKMKNGVVAAAPAKAVVHQAAPEKAAAPKADAPVPLTPTGRSAPDAWKEAMNQLKKSDPGTFGILNQGTFSGCDGNLFRWQAPAGMDFFVIAMNKENKRAVIADALTKAVGIESRFEAVLPTAKENKVQVQSDDDYLGAMMSTFGA